MDGLADRGPPPSLAEPRLRLLETLDLSGDAATLAACAASDFIATRAQLDGEWFRDFASSGGWRRRPTRAEIRTMLESAVAGAGRVDELLDPLRLARHRMMVGAVWRHVLGVAELDETTGCCTDLADVFIDVALERVHAWAVERYGEPVGETSGAPQRLVVLGLGKLGAGELNLSSDVDLQFAYRETGRTSSGRSNQQFFVQVAQGLVGALDTPTGQGFAFRVDTRLRPYGGSGPLVCSFDALESYYADQGRDWERYALVKTRPCAGDLPAGEELLVALQPFVYRRYLDFGALSALRSMKDRIDRERRGAAVRKNVKLGSGGIREIEFMAQVQQLIWGGRRLELREPRVRRALDAMARFDMIDGETAARLTDSYVYLRNVEHSVQAIADRQTHSLPDGELDQARVAWMMGAPDYESFLAVVDGHRQFVARCFEEAIALPETEADQRSSGLWDGDEEAAPEVAEWLDRLRRARDKASVSGDGRERLDRLMPLLIERLEGRPEPLEHGLSRLVPVLEAVLRRSAYLLLLIENPPALDALIDLASRSKWIANEVAQHPVLFDELLTGQEVSGVPAREDLAWDIDWSIALAGPNDPERVLDALREFKQAHAFRAAAAEMAGRLPLMRVSDYLTFLAEALLDRTLAHAWRETFGTEEPSAGEREGLAPRKDEIRDFVVIGYGKLGGLELGPGSDLDLVFLHDFPATRQRDLHRLVRRFLHALTVMTARGQLYEVDMRLRPSGRAGPMVSAIDGFARYQHEQAWTWENQAIVRARVVAGDRALGGRFDATRITALTRARDRAKLRDDIVSMRARIAEASKEDVDLKRGAGGIVDVEFLVQFLVLANAHEHQELCAFTDNVRILETAAEAGLLEPEEAEALTDAYLGLRSELHRSVLDLPDAARASDVLERYRETIRGAWERLLGPEAT